jgi:TPR repeat protein
MGNTKAPPEVLETIRTQNTALVDEALQYLPQAIANRPNYDDAMAYLNLVYRRKADCDWADPAARNDDVAKAQEWARKAMLTRKENEEKRHSAPTSP